MALAAAFFWVGVACDSWAGGFDFEAPLFQETGTYGQKGFSFQLAEAAKGGVSVDKPGTVVASPGTIPDSPWWVRATAGYDYSFLGDVINGTKAWTPLFQAQGGSGSSFTENSGLLLGLETGWQLDGDNSISLSGENILSATQSQSATLGGGTQYQSFAPSLLEGSVNYYRCFHGLFGGKESRTFLTLGAGYYHATVQYTLNQTGGFSNASGTFTGDILGGTAGLVQEFKFSRDFGMDLSVRGRMANFSRMSAANVTGAQGIIPGSSGPYSLTIYNLPVGGNTYSALLFDSNSRVGKVSDRYASVDYSGIDADASFSFYF
jgi:hypothetical protein